MCLEVQDRQIRLFENSQEMQIEAVEIGFEKICRCISESVTKMLHMKQVTGVIGHL